MRIQLRFEGGQDLAHNLGQLSNRVSRQVTFEALKLGAEPIRLESSRIAPHAPGQPDLRANIRSMVARGRDADGQPTVAIGPTQRVFYGLFQEFGTSQHAAQPFMRPGFDVAWRSAVSIIRGAFWRAIISRGISTARTSPEGGGLL